MTLEADLKRKLEIRFIDARELIVEAKVNLGTSAYPTPQEEREVMAEAERMFEERSQGFKVGLQEANTTFEAVKEKEIKRSNSRSPKRPTHRKTPTAATATSVSSGRSSSSSPRKPSRKQSKIRSLSPMRNLGKRTLVAINDRMKAAAISK